MAVDKQITWNFILKKNDRYFLNKKNRPIVDGSYHSKNNYLAFSKFSEAFFQFTIFQKAFR